jgi:hypothetical protein
MQASTQSATTNPAGGLKIIRDDPHKKYKRSDDICDLKKVAKKQDRSSRPDRERR